MTPREAAIEAVSNLLIELWNMAVERREPSHAHLPFSFDTARSAKAVFDDLMGRLDHTTIQFFVVTLLERVVGIYDSGGVPDKRNIFLARCCLELIGAADVPLPMPVTLVKDVVRVFPSAGWYSVVERVISLRLTKLETLEALRNGLTLKGDRDVCLSCVEGLRLYRNAPTSDGSQEALGALKQDVRGRIERLRQHTEPLITKSISQARDYLERW